MLTRASPLGCFHRAVSPIKQERHRPRLERSLGHRPTTPKTPAMCVLLYVVQFNLLLVMRDYTACD